jgi:large subunit ribosomal protein L5|tara:strand:+ start:218 stop:754 length:537 start_codon:yes stop_codon:yes gene_type:complete
MNRLTYNDNVSKEDLLTRYQYKNVYEIPKLDKIIISLSLKQSRFDRKQLPKLLLASTLITGQKAKAILTKRGDASLGIRKNDPVGTKVTLRGDNALNFIDFINTLILPRVKNFEGLDKKNINIPKSFNFQINNALAFPQLEMAYEQFNNLGPINISIVFKNTNEEDIETSLRNLNVPF